MNWKGWKKKKREKERKAPTFTEMGSILREGFIDLAALAATSDFHFYIECINALRMKVRSKTIIAY